MKVSVPATKLDIANVALQLALICYRQSDLLEKIIRSDGAPPIDDLRGIRADVDELLNTALQLMSAEMGSNG